MITKKDIFYSTLAFIFVVVVVIGLGWLFTGSHLLLNKFFNPKFEEVRRDTYEQSKSYRDGTIQDLRAMQIEYIKAKDELKPALAYAIKHKASGVPVDILPSDLHVFLRELP